MTTNLATKNNCYVYVYLDPRKPGKYNFDLEEMSFLYEPFYVGKGTGDRLLKHLTEYEKNKNYNPYKNSKINKIIKENKYPIILKYKENLLEKDAFDVEIKLILKIGKKSKNGPLTNLCDGGDGSFSKESRTKQAETMKRLYKEGKLIHPMLGKTHKDNSKKKMSNAKLGKKFTLLQKEKLKKVRCEKKNISQTLRWKVISPQGEEFVIYGLGEFCRNNNIQQAHMFEVANNRRKHHKGWKCEYYSE